MEEYFCCDSRLGQWHKMLKMVFNLLDHPEWMQAIISNYQVVWLGYRNIHVTLKMIKANLALHWWSPILVVCHIWHLECDD